MLKKILMLIPALSLFGALAVAPVSYAACSTHQKCASQGVNSAKTGGENTDEEDVIQSIVNLLLYITGAVAVIMIVIGGIKYVTSGGDSSQTKSAKDTILYAVVGLIIAIIAYAVVNFVIGAFVAKP